MPYQVKNKLTMPYYFKNKFTVPYHVKIKFTVPYHVKIKFKMPNLVIREELSSLIKLWQGGQDITERVP